MPPPPQASSLIDRSREGYIPISLRCVSVKRDPVSVKRDLVSVKRDLVSVKRDLVSVKRDLPLKRGVHPDIAQVCM